MTSSIEIDFFFVSLFALVAMPRHYRQLNNVSLNISCMQFRWQVIVVILQNVHDSDTVIFLDEGGGG